MAANFGKNYKISIFGESHGSALGINIDGIPAGTELDLEFISQEMRRRAPGRSKLTTPRVEKDEFEILSGFFDGKTTGTPLAMIIRNSNQRSKDYSELKRKPRPGHADWSGFNRYNGFNDIRGSGHFSGRITASLVFAGAIAKQILKSQGILIAAHIKSVKDIEDRDFVESDITEENIEKLRNMTLPVLNEEIVEKIEKAVEILKNGGVAVFPTDTVYGIGSLPEKESVEKIYKIKKRDFSKKIIALINDRKILKDLVNETEEDMKKFSKIFDECWPGELTVIFRANCDFTKKFDEKMKTIGIRIPKNKIALEIIEKSGGVVLTTSANISGESAVKRIEDLSKELIKNVDIIYLLDKGKIIGAICNGASFLCLHGFLNNVKHTGNGLDQLKQWGGIGYTNAENYVEAQAVSDKNIVTANGVGHLEFTREMLLLLEANTPENIASWYDFYKNGFVR